MGFLTQIEKKIILSKIFEEMFVSFEIVEQYYYVLIKIDQMIDK